MLAVETVIVGAGQAGLALSHCLGAREHIVLERGRVGERWRSERWDSLTLLTPNWLNTLPGADPLPDPDGYLDRAGVVEHLETYAACAPVLERTTVLGVRQDAHGYRIATDGGELRSRNVVIATGDCDVPRMPVAAAGAPGFLHQLHASRYRNPAELPDGGVLVVGAGPSGQQIAAELLRAGRRVVLAAGRHARMPRRYRGSDAFVWLHALGQLHVHVDDVRDLAAAKRTPSFPLSGTRGGESLGLDVLAQLGAVVTGRLKGFAGSHAIFASDLGRHVADAEARMRRTLVMVDRHIEVTGTAAGPADAPSPVVLENGPSSLDLGGNIRTVLWATGYRRAYPWLRVPVLDTAGELVHREGVTAALGLYALGLRFQRTRSSHFLAGVGDDAAQIARAIESGDRLAVAA